MSDTSTDGMGRFEKQEEHTFVERHGHVNEITVGTVLEYSDWQWALVTELAVDRDEPKFGFILLDEVGDHTVQQLETANGCRQHYEVVQHLRGGQHEYWTPVEYVVEDDIWSVLGPTHPDYRTDDDEKELVTDGGIEQVGVSCDSCDYTLTIKDVIEREEDRHGRTPSASRIRSKFGSLGEGHAYFNRGHTVKLEIPPQEIERALEADTDRSGDVD